MSGSTVYNENFYNRQRDASFDAAMSILPILFNVSRPNSLVDFGCGVGSWIAAAKKLGVQECLGIEGEWVRSQTLMVRPGEIVTADLEKPVILDRKFDLALSLEVAEHLTTNRADTFVSDLCLASDQVLFSAAAPGQDGHGHLNEQPASFWGIRFVRNGYIPLDIIRPVAAGMLGIPYWYKTNIVLYVRERYAYGILKNVNEKHLESLDLPFFVQAEGIKRASSRLFFYGRKLLLTAGSRLRRRAGLK